MLQQNSYHVAIVHGNATYEIGYLFADAGGNAKIKSTTVYSHLNSGEEVWMICLTNSTIVGDFNDPTYGGAQQFHSHFSGFLVSED